MKVISRESKTTFTDSHGSDRHYTNYYLVADNGKSVQLRCAFSDDYRSLGLIANNDVQVVLIKKQAKTTYKNSKGIDCHYYNYYLQVGNNLIQIRCAYAPDYARLDMICNYVS